MSIWFTADHHFGHKNIINYVPSRRIFYSTQQMDNVMIERWNKVVKPKDTVYHLGDFSLSPNPDYYFEKLNGTVKIIRGNHDKWMDRKALFPNTKEGTVHLYPAEYEVKDMGTTIVLSHYPMRSWNKSFHGSWHLFGHVHGVTEPYGRSLDVGVDTNNFYPYSFEEIKVIMEAREPTKI